MTINQHCSLYYRNDVLQFRVVKLVFHLNLGGIMARVKKSVSKKEQELKDIISDTKKKLANLQNKQKMDIGELACDHGLNKFDLKVLDEAFKKLHAQLSHAK